MHERTIHVLPKKGESNRKKTIALEWNVLFQSPFFHVNYILSDIKLMSRNQIKREHKIWKDMDGRYKSCNSQTHKKANRISFDI